MKVKKLRAILFFFAGLTCTCGCQPTPYQRLGTTSAGGYSETRFSVNEFHVKFVANDNTPSRTVCIYLYRRAAEVTLENGFRYFIVIRGPRQLTERVHLYSSQDYWNDMPNPIEVDVPDPEKLHMTIQCFKDFPQDCDMSLIDAKAHLQKHFHYKLERPMHK